MAISASRSLHSPHHLHCLTWTQSRQFVETHHHVLAHPNAIDRCLENYDSTPPPALWLLIWTGMQTRKCIQVQHSADWWRFGFCRCASLSLPLPSPANQVANGDVTTMELTDANALDLVYPLTGCRLAIRETTDVCHKIAYAPPLLLLLLHRTLTGRSLFFMQIDDAYNLI